MEQALLELCRKHRIQPAREPASLFSSANARLLEDATGCRYVVKTKDAGENPEEVLRSFQSLHPPFLHPCPLSDVEDPYLLYPYLKGKPLREGLFESDELTDHVADTIGRLQALMRSLALASHYRQAPREDASTLESLVRWTERIQMSSVQALDDQQKKARIQETAESYAWTERRVEDACIFARSALDWEGAVLDAFKERTYNTFSIHVPVVGSILCHTALHPEHLILSPKGGLGIVGWHLAPRPRFFMLHTHLAWSFFHSLKDHPVDFYRERLRKKGREAFHKEHHLVFALCLLDRLVHFHEHPALHADALSSRRLHEARALWEHCVTEAGRESGSGIF